LLDFSSERSIAKTAEALKEHYNLSLSTSAILKITHQKTKEAKEFNSNVSAPLQKAPTMIVEIDGSMVPTVEYSEVTEDQVNEGFKRNRNCQW